ncbi:gliding motility-associated-like protein [Winogradskyella wandonensis]|uniref:Gliding motility-associated-like protein n=1 Tax=Winogradskyella wandonensis TaxID=1442586 RepID=A0A4R1KRJ6_9FLAO|nr:choice-of-anchor L domain-containing protein [Winogradskyella wandonensis]TCK66749.1 gliding motility-associated-like protein [Winogradskyella wandonensis]
MRYYFLAISFFFFLLSNSQNITVDSQLYNPQELIEDILIDSDCIDNVVVTNAQSGDFGGVEFSYGFFDGTGTTFPFESGIVMSTGRLSNVPGPNNSLSDDDAPNWNGDDDLEEILDENNTFNATILEFNFTAITNQISFRYLFASEEYQENNSNTCIFSDLFGFLIKPSDNSQPFQNIAVIPGTNTPVKVTTVTPGISGSCPSQNETFFGGFNGAMSPINFNGQTAVLTATADIISGQEYTIKLVIADEQNFRFDSAVFLEAGSFQASRDLGQNRLLATNNPLCEGETLLLDGTISGNNGYDWYRDGVLVQSDPVGCTNCGTYEVTQPGIYTLEVNLDGTCVANGEITIEYSPNPEGSDVIQVECDANQDGLTFYNLLELAADIRNNDPDLTVSNFFLSEMEAIDNINPIETPTSFENTIPNQIVYARVENPFGCFDVAELELQISNNTLNIPTIEACDFGELDGLTTFDLNEVITAIDSQIPTGATINFFETENDAFTGNNSLTINFDNSVPDFQTIFVKVENNDVCYAISEVDLQVKFTPAVSEDITVIYCTNTFPETIRLFGGVLNDLPNNYYYEWQLNGTPLTTTTSFIDVNEIGTYTVIITDPNGCSNTRDIIVVPSEIAQIDAVDVIGSDTINTITIVASGLGDYEYALDNENGPYQDENVFNNILPGFHTVFVRDKNGCGIDSEIFSVLGFPKFFTPNGDGQNDFWQLDGINFQLYPDLEVTIYDRFGKLMTRQDSRSSGWDGNYNGTLMPNSDYWFTANFGDGRTFTGHFALKR